MWEFVVAVSLREREREITAKKGSSKNKKEIDEGRSKI